MRVTLINPPFEDEYSVGSCRSIKYVLNVIPPLGLAYLAGILRKHGVEVRIVDYAVEKFSLEAALTGQPDIVGITAATPTFETAKFLARGIKKLLPNVILVLGGAHVTAMPHQAIEEDCFDIGVIGEGEVVFLELIRHIEEKKLSGLNAVRGIIFKDGKESVLTPKRRYVDNLDEIPYPARDLLPPLSKYKPTPASYKKLPLGVMITSRGCPQQCTFCDRGVFGNQYRQRSPENVLGEAEELIYKYGAKEIRFFDDCFTLNHKRTLQVCSGLKKFKIPWTCLTTVGSVNKELLYEMRSAGCWQVLFGLESGDGGILARLKKGATLEMNRTAVKLAKEAGLSVRADFIIGTPGETEETLNKTLSFALENKLDYAHFNKFVPYPGTRLYQELKDNGYVFNFDKGSSITDNGEFLYIPESIVRKDYYRDFVNYAHRKFYLRLSYIIKRLISLATFTELKGQVKGFFSIVLLGKKDNCAKSHF